MTPKRQKDEYLLSAQEPAEPAHLRPAPAGAVSRAPIVPRRKLRHGAWAQVTLPNSWGAEVRSQGICSQVLCFPRFLGGERT